MRYKLVESEYNNVDEIGSKSYDDMPDETVVLCLSHNAANSAGGGPH